MLMFTHKQEISDFATIKDIQDLDGYYLNRIDKTSMLSCFNIRDYADFVTITSENPNEVKLIYYCDSTKQEQKFKGQMTKKYFEIYFSKRQVFIPFIYSSFDINRIRIGKTEEGQLLIRKFIAQSGSIFIFEDGYSIETPYKFSYAYAYKNYIPVQKDGLWGYSDSLGNIVIPIKYDFACIFEHDFARVKLNNKWGLINKRGEAIIPLQYDEIISMETIFPPVFRVSILEKKGILDIKGNEIVPVIYDYIGKYSSHGLVSIRLKDKWGGIRKSYSSGHTSHLFRIKRFCVFSGYSKTRRKVLHCR
jgi:hypothetical protein